MLKIENFQNFQFFMFFGRFSDPEVAWFRKSVCNPKRWRSKHPSESIFYLRNFTGIFFKTNSTENKFGLFWFFFKKKFWPHSEHHKTDFPGSGSLKIEPVSQNRVRTRRWDNKLMFFLVEFVLKKIPVKFQRKILILMGVCFATVLGLQWDTKSVAISPDTVENIWISRIFQNLSKFETMYLRAQEELEARETCNARNMI